MRFARSRANVGVLDGRIYVIGGCRYNNLSNWAEVFDPKMQTWSKVNVWVSRIYNFRGEEGMWNLNKKSYCDMKRLLYSCDCRGEIVWCDPWNEVRRGRISWKKVHGLEEYFRLPLVSVLQNGEMANVWHCYLLSHGCVNGFFIPEYKLSISDGNIVMFWNKFVEKEPKRMQIWCTEISTERHEGGEVCGTVQWSEHVYTVDHLPYHLKVLHSVSVAI